MVPVSNPEQEQSLRLQREALDIRVYDLREQLSKVEQEWAVVMNALKMIVDQRRVA